MLNSVDIGITPVPLAIFGKSASAAAMLEHGLPVLVSRVDQLEPTALADWNRHGVFPLHDQLSRQLAEGLPRPARGSRLPEVARAFLGQLR
jgi:hypothetical protein